MEVNQRAQRSKLWTIMRKWSPHHVIWTAPPVLLSLLICSATSLIAGSSGRSRPSAAHSLMVASITRRSCRPKLELAYLQFTWFLLSVVILHQCLYYTLIYSSTSTSTMESVPWRAFLVETSTPYWDGCLCKMNICSLKNVSFLDNNLPWLVLSLMGSYCEKEGDTDCPMWSRLVNLIGW